MSETNGRNPAAIRKSLEVLGAWYRLHKPGVTRMVVAQDDFDRLTNAAPATLIRNGFKAVKGVGIYWSEFELVRK